MPDSSLPAQAMELIARLVATREMLGLSQDDVARRMGTAQSSVARLESGKHDPRASTLERYAAALGAKIRFIPETSATDPAPAALPAARMQADMPEGLTRKQAEILEVLAAGRAVGRAPSLREIGEAVGLASTSSVAYQLGELEQKGYIRRYPQRQRAIEVLLPPDWA
jgi:transcriptional regulator with XRE-family HTH domain